MPGTQDEESTKDNEAWIVYCDGSWETFGAGAAAILISPSKIKTCYTARLEFNCTNNIAEYEVVVLGLQKLKAMGIRRAILKSFSQVITGQAISTKAAEQEIRSLRRIWIQFEEWKSLSKASQ
jgi:ribonuclease HI